MTTDSRRLGRGRSLTDDVREELTQGVLRRVASRGWVDTGLDGRPVVFGFMRPARNGVIATATLFDASPMSSFLFRLDVNLVLGAGYQPAFDLLSSLWYGPSPSLIYMPSTSPVVGEFQWLRTIRRRSGVRALSADIADALGGAVEFADSIADVDALERRYRAEVTRLGGDLSPGFLALLAVTGRQEEVRSLLASSRREDPMSGYNPRVSARLLTWMDTGRAEMGEDEEKPLERFLDPTPHHRRAERVAREAAIAAVRAQAQGKSAAELLALLIWEYRERRVRYSPTAAADIAEIIAAETGPFGRVVSAARVANRATVSVRALVDAVSDVGQKPLALELELELPQPTDSFTQSALGGPHFVVELSDGMGDWLEEVTRPVRDRAGMAAFDALVRLTPHTDDQAAPQVQVQVGRRIVGWVSDQLPAEFMAYLAGLADRQSDLIVRGRLRAHTDSLPAICVVSLPTPRWAAPSIPDAS